MKRGQSSLEFVMLAAALLVFITTLIIGTEHVYIGAQNDHEEAEAAAVLVRRRVHQALPRDHHRREARRR